MNDSLQNRAGTVACIALAFVAFSLAHVAWAETLRPCSVPAARCDLSRYSLRACWNGVKTNAVKALLFTPKPVGKAGLPLVVYLPGRGEIGDVARQFRQRTIFDLVTSEGFQKRHPCFLLALSPPESATTLLGGSPGRPTAVQRALHEFVLSVCRQSGKPKIDTNRVYLTGFSYGGNGVYALALNFPGFYAAAIPIAALPPVAESVSDVAPGSWWHFYNEGDYARHEMNAKTLRAFASAVVRAGGDFRLGRYPADAHDAWTRAWREDAVWDWAFSKSLDGKARTLTKAARERDPCLSLIEARCSASVPGRDAATAPMRVIDGLDTTWYEPKRAFEKDDWWRVDFGKPLDGRVRLVSGDKSGAGVAKGLVVEVSSDGERWSRMGTFSGRDGVCSFVTRGAVRFVRVRSASERPQTFRLRRIDVVPSP